MEANLAAQTGTGSVETRDIWSQLCCKAPLRFNRGTPLKFTEIVMVTPLADVKPSG